MRASSADEEEASEVGDAEEFDFDYSDFFSVLMYYGKMSKEDILNSSRPFLYAVYKQYGKRACENLGVSPDNEKEEQVDEEEYPSMFKKLTPKERENGLKEFENSEDFMKIFGESPSSKMKFMDGKRVIEI